MIKRIRFATRNQALDRASFPPAWVDATSVVAGVPVDIRPARIALCLSLPDVLADPRHDGIGIEWFTDAAHLSRFEAWLDEPAGHAVSGPLETVLAIADSPVVVADEVVMRGAEWLDNRWRAGGEKVKHMAIARRAGGLTPEEFSARWRGRAGQVATATGPATVIPDEARGLAYVQNHPLPTGPGGWAYDALNEVYFDDVESLRRRIAWFAEVLTGSAEADLVSASWFVAAREQVVWSEPPTPSTE